MNREHAPPLNRSLLSRRGKWLLAGLLCLAIVYGALLPWRRQVGTEVARLDRVAEARQKEEIHLQDLHNSLAKAQEEVTRSPGDVQAHMALAAQYHTLGRLEDAAQQAEIAVGLSPQEIAPLLLLADVQQHARHYAAAIRAYKMTLVRQSGNLQASVGLSYLYVMFGWPQDAVTLLEPVVQANPQNPQVKVALALAYVQQSNYKEVERLLLEARHLAPQEAALWTPLVHLYNLNKRYVEAAAVGRDALALLPENVPLIVETGQSYYHLNAYEDALRMLDRALTLSPDDPGAHYYRGLCYQKQNRPEKAIEDMEAVLRHNPNFEQTRQILGTLYIHRSRSAEGERLLAEVKSANDTAQTRAHIAYVVSNQPRSAAAHWQMAQTYLREKDSNRALVELDKTLELDPSREEARSLRDRLNPDKAPRH